MFVSISKLRNSSAYIFAQNVPDSRLLLLHRLTDPQRLQQLGVGHDQVLPVDEEDGDVLLGQQVGAPDALDEHLVKEGEW